ncbi:hypothetical protein DDB_G0282857 [Dictyostelium discoideum AX4]|uniref:DUF5898 domain-containing protein n=1 Tax=Dictyostelium discoideum TaxID=44689 RepID=Q54RX3_DICDI|nr:hypothetical protein DDB_G0282857 [Dictyostelium discoideum AX4]EAL66008.1 hypothetical protein DDB_G0282857 [Dictyostelium discoideum AX4]|eukprot:XP_639364.1 hypothetical protein DDB_G0282857 [Dictyostelium discoideum AX4]
MGDNNLDYKKAYEELLEKQKEKEIEKAYKVYEKLLEKQKESQKRQKEIEKENKELLEKQKESQKKTKSNGKRKQRTYRKTKRKSKTNYIGLIQVKCSELSFHDPKVIGQLFDYLMGLSYLFGKLQAFGLLLTPNKVMPLFTHDSLGLAANDIQSTLPHATSVLPIQISKTVKSKPNIKEFDRVLYTSSSNQSILSNISPTSSSSNTTSLTYSSSNTSPTSNSSSNTTSPIFSSSPLRDIEKPRGFFELICSTIFKMRESQFDPSKEGTRLFLQANSLCFKAKSVEISTSKYLTTLKEIDKKLLDEIYLVKYLGGGGHGHCSYALTEKGHSLVIKSFNNTIIKEKREEERRLWGTIWGIETIIKTYSAKDHLVMPFIKPIGNDDYNSIDFTELISTAADTFSSKGYEHMDLYIRHICKYKKNDKYINIFIDLSRVSEATDKDQAKQRMIKSILDDLKYIRSNDSLTNKEQPNCPILPRFSKPFTVPSTPIV